MNSVCEVMYIVNFWEFGFTSGVRVACLYAGLQDAARSELGSLSLNRLHTTHATRRAAAQLKAEELDEPSAAPATTKQGVHTEFWVLSESLLHPW